MDYDGALVEEISASMRQNVPSQARQFAFGPEVAAPGDAPALDRMAGFLGRQP
jgi:hypothetical protein